MLQLSKTYKDEADVILKDLMASELHTAYLESEEEEDYTALRDSFEPKMIELHSRVMDENPLQIIGLEELFLNENYEGLILPKILGYSVLRGEHDENFKYRKPQDHFEKILLGICNSANFEWLKKRIGQSIQTGFALSSDIWITNLINKVNNKRVRYFLQSQKIPQYRILDERKRARGRFARQFRNDYFYTASFPTAKKDLSTDYYRIKTFLVTRFKFNKETASFEKELMEFVSNPAFFGTKEHTYILGLAASFIDWKDPEKKVLTDIYTKLRNDDANFSDMHLDFILDVHASHLDLDNKADNRTSACIDKNIKDELSAFYKLMDEVHGKGYVHKDAVEAVRHFYNNHEGLSKINQAVRKTILNYIHRVITNLDEQGYPLFMELIGEIPSKMETADVTEERPVGAYAFPLYMDIFSNQQFNQFLKDLSLSYVKKLLKVHVDKRGKDYQDIKKFVASTFVEMNFLNQKQVVELFKTRRKKKKPETA